MACGGCAERRAAIVEGAKAALKGDTATAITQAKLVASTASRDAKGLFARQLRAARQRLSRR